MAFLLKQVCSRTTFVYHKKSEWERYKTYPVEDPTSTMTSPKVIACTGRRNFVYL